MKKLSLVLIAVLFLISCTPKIELENMTGYYEGAIDVLGEELKLTLELEREETLEGFVDIAVQGVYGLDIHDVIVLGNRVTFSITAGGNLGTFDGLYEKNVFSGDFTQAGQSFPFKLTKTEKVVMDSVEVFTLENDDIILRGEYMIPEKEAEMPVVLIIAGSGPTDLNGNSPAGVSTDTYKYLAIALKEAGIASLRYNKRSIGNVFNEEDLTFDDFVDDAVKITEHLKKDTRFSEVIVLGHSQGALIAELVADQIEVDKIILIAGAGHSIDKVLYDQLATNLDEETLKTVKMGLDLLAEGKMIEEVPAGLESLFRKSVQPFLISWIKYDPVVVLNDLEEEVLVVVGTEDLQTPLKEAEAFKTSSKPYTYKVIENMNHVLKTSSSDTLENLATYKDMDLPLHEELVDVLIEFLNQ